MNTEETIAKISILYEEYLYLVEQEEEESLALEAFDAILGEKSVLEESIRKLIFSISQEMTVKDIGEKVMFILEHPTEFYKSSKEKILIAIDQSPNYGAAFYNDPYIIVQDGDSKVNNHMARINIKDGYIVNHCPRNQTRPMSPNADQIKDLPKIMKKKCNTGRYQNLTVEEAIKTYLDETYGSKSDYKKIEQLADFENIRDERRGKNAYSARRDRKIK